MADVVLDLFGDPVPPEHVGRGRPPHVPDDKKRSKVMLLLALGKTEDEIAAVLGITGKTLRKHYSRETKVRDHARLRLDAELLAQLAGEAAKGNVSAIDKLFKRLDRHDLGGVVPTKSKAKAPKPGKKEQAAIDAQTAHQTGSWGNLLN